MKELYCRYLRSILSLIYQPFLDIKFSYVFVLYGPPQNMECQLQGKSESWTDHVDRTNVV